MKHCSSLKKAMCNVNNDGQTDLVVKTMFCMKESVSDSLYIFPATVLFLGKPICRTVPSAGGAS